MLQEAIFCAYQLQQKFDDLECENEQLKSQTKTSDMEERTKLLEDANKVSYNIITVPFL